MKASAADRSAESETAGDVQRVSSGDGAEVETPLSTASEGGPAVNISIPLHVVDAPRPTAANDAATVGVAVIVLHWRRLDETLECLESVAALRPGPSATYVVVAEADGQVVDALAERFPEVITLSIAGNPGYAAGNNHGIQRAIADGAEWLWLLNDDTRVASDCLGHLMNAHRGTRAAALGPMVVQREYPARVLTNGGQVDAQGRATLIGLDQRASDMELEPIQVDFVSGCALLLGAHAIRDIGAIDEEYFLYYEEVDWCARARQRGYDVLVVPTARASHPDTRTRDAERPHVTYYTARNQLRFLARAGFGKAARWRARLRHARTLLSWTIRPKWRHKAAHRDALLRALWHEFRGRTGALHSAGSQ